MKKEAFELIKKELKYVGLLFLAALAIFKAVFYKENFIVLVRYVLSLFWLFVLPGYAIMLYWMEKLDFLERIVVGIAASAAVTGILSYYIGLLGLDIKYHAVLLPLTLIIAGIIITIKKKRI